MTEAVLQRLILGQLHQLDRDHFGARMERVDGKRRWVSVRIRVWRANVGARPWTDSAGKKRVVQIGRRGQADVTGVILLDSGVGQRYECEIKRPGEKRSPEQIRFAEEMVAGGALYAVAYEVEQALAPVRAALGIV